MISVDFEKCFDRIEFSAISGALKHFGFGERIIDYVITTYKGFKAVVQK